MVFISTDEYFWSGKSDDTEVLISFKKNVIVGQFRKDREVYELQELESGEGILIEYDMNVIDQLTCATDGSNMANDRPDTLQNWSVENFRMISKSNKEAITNTEYLNSGPPVIRALVFYTQSVSQQGVNIQNLVNLAVQQWQTATLNSNVNVMLEISDIKPLDFTESNNIYSDIDLFTNNTIAQNFRNSTLSDIVILLTNGSYTGIAGIVKEIGPNNPNTYTIVQIGAATSNFTLIHEVGHLLGARHQKPSDNTPGDAHGHNWTGPLILQNPNFRSIMSISSGRQRVLHFSNPDVFHQNARTGIVNEANNSRILNVNGPIVEAFRVAPNLLWASINGPSSANSGQSLSFSPFIQGGQGPYGFSWQVNTGFGFYSAGSNSSPLIISMPNDANLQIRLTVTDANSNVFTANLFVQNNFLGGGCTVCPDNLDLLKEDIGIDGRLVLYPNPANRNISLKYKNIILANSQIQVFDISGDLDVSNLVKVISVTEDQIDMDISELRYGVHLVVFQDVSGNLISVKFIKK